MAHPESPFTYTALLGGKRGVDLGTLTQIDEGEMILDSAFVSEPFRRRGIYKQLVRDRVEVARQMGAGNVLLSASETNNAKRWLGEFGFNIMSSSDNGNWVDFEMKL